MNIFRTMVLSFLFFSTLMLAVAEPVTFAFSLRQQDISSSEKISETINRVVASGATRVIIPADWPTIEAQKGVFCFDALDALLSVVEEAKLQPVLLLGPSPNWAVTYLDNPGPEEIARAHPDLAAYRNYVAIVARRYRGRVFGYQLWQQPTAYALLAQTSVVYSLYQAGTLALRSADPDARVIIAEPGDVKIAWIADYLQFVKDKAVPDIILLSQDNANITLREFAWHIQALREKALISDSSPKIWMKFPLPEKSDCPSESLLAMALIQQLTDIVLETAKITLEDLHIAPMNDIICAISGMDYAGWAEAVPGVFCSRYQRQDSSRLILLPYPGAVLPIVPTTGEYKCGILADKMVVTTLGGERTTETMEAPKDYSCFAGYPLMFSDATLPLTQTGHPDCSPEISMENEVTLDFSGEDPDAIRGLRYIKGGYYAQYNIDGRPMMATIREVTPWMHFDIPDSFVFYNREKVAFDITFEVIGAVEENKTGFNLYYDALDGIRITPWQWIAVGKDKTFSYTFRITDALFSGRDGYDLRLNMGGSIDNVRVVALTVRKVKLPVAGTIEKLPGKSLPGSPKLN